MQARFPDSLARWCSALVIGWLGLGCGDDDSSRGADDPAPSEDGAAPAIHDVESLLSALHQSHAEARRALGPHRLHYEGTFELSTPGGETEPVRHPELDAPVVRPHAVHDELTLVWAPAEAGPRFSLSQHNDHERGREVILDGERIYVKQQHRPWLVAPVETDHHELWLDDAQHAVHDIVAMAAPSLSIETTTNTGDDGEQVVVRLMTSNAVRRDLLADGAGQAWRGGATIEEIRGEIVLDAATGTWRSADVYVQYALPGPDGRILRGTSHVHGTVELLSGGAAPFGVPTDAIPLPERIRYEEERARLLDGLAAP